MTTMTIAMNAVSPPVAAAAFATTAAIALSNAGLNIENIYKTGRDVYDIAKHENLSDYLMHHGIKGQKWGVRRFQDESGSLTGLGKLRANTDSEWHAQKKSTSGDFMQDLHNDIAVVNRGGSAGDLGRGTNCLYCTTAYEMRRRGYDVQAQQDWVGGIRGDMPAAMFDGAKTEVAFDISNVLIDSPDRITQSMLATQQVIGMVEAQGEGARGYINVVWAGGQGGHSMAYEVVDGQMHLIDCQTGEDLTGEDIWSERLLYADSCNITRVDNCEVNKQMVDRYIEDVGTKDSDNVMDEVLDQLVDRLRKKRKKKKNQKDSSIKKQVNKYGKTIGSIWNKKARDGSKKARSFVNTFKGVI